MQYMHIAIIYRLTCTYVLFICIICHRTSRKFKDINFIPFPKKFEIGEKWLKALKLTENDKEVNRNRYAVYAYSDYI
jgi:hypothetical protein